MSTDDTRPPEGRNGMAVPGRAWRAPLLDVVERSTRDYFEAVAGLPTESPHELGYEHEQNCVRVLLAAVRALAADASANEQELMSDLCDLVDGAGGPGKRFNLDIAELTALIQRTDSTRGRQLFSRRAEDSGRSMAEEWATDTVLLAQILVPKLPVFENLSEAAAVRLLMPLLNRCASHLIKPVGVVADLLKAALERGVVFGNGATLGVHHTREQLVKLVDQACRRYPASDARST